MTDFSFVVFLVLSVLNIQKNSYGYLLQYKTKWYGIQYNTIPYCTVSNLENECFFFFFLELKMFPEK